MMCIHVCLSACEARRGHQHPLELEYSYEPNSGFLQEQYKLNHQPPKVILFSGGSTTAPKKDSLGVHPWGYPYLLKPFLCRLRNPSEDAAPDLPAIRDLKKLEFA